MSNGLVLSVFPGIDLLGRAFEEEGYCVVRGPDLLWGGDIRTFHPPAGIFEGVIGGPPCQAFSRMRHFNPSVGRHGNLVPEYERVVAESLPNWFVMENVPEAPTPKVGGYKTWDTLVRDKWVGGVQSRKRRFTFGSDNGAPLDIPWVALEDPRTVLTVVAGHDAPPGNPAQGMLSRDYIPLACEAMGLPRDFTEEMPFTAWGKRSVIGNGVPMAMGRAIAKAVRRATTGAAELGKGT